jgi:hypothetical protein
MLTRDQELEQFKTDINLTEYAAAQGYVLDKRASSRNSVTMRESTGAKIIIARAPDAHWIYFNVHDDGDQGSIIDFVQTREGCNLGQVRKELRPWIGSGAVRLKVPATHYVPELEPLPRDIVGVRARFARFSPIEDTHPYLERVRSIPTDVLTSRPFRDRIFIDERGNALFPHQNRDGLCGFEIKNKDFTGFARGGVKGLWFSRRPEAPTSLVIAETAIDALSYAALYPDEGATYLSIAGQLSPEQKDLVSAAIGKMPSGSTIILAMDHDEAGKSLIETVTGLISPQDAPGTVFRPSVPPTPNQDWNDALRANLGESNHFSENQRHGPKIR